MLIEVGAAYYFKYSNRHTRTLCRLSTNGFLYAVKNNLYADRQQNKLNLTKKVSFTDGYQNNYIVDFDLMDFQNFMKDNEAPNNSNRVINMHYNMLYSN